MLKLIENEADDDCEAGLNQAQRLVPSREAALFSEAGQALMSNQPDLAHLNQQRPG